MKKNTLVKLEGIARDKMHIPTLEVRRADGLDFHEIYVGGLKEALLAAYELGKEHGAGAGEDEKTPLEVLKGEVMAELQEMYDDGWEDRKLLDEVMEALHQGTHDRLLANCAESEHTDQWATSAQIAKMIIGLSK